MNAIEIVFWFGWDAVFPSRPHHSRDRRAGAVQAGRRPPRSGAQRPWRHQAQV